ncbi:hypothetical protein V1477_018850, partial [Vespula maculifrons]
MEKKRNKNTFCERVPNNKEFKEEERVVDGMLDRVVCHVELLLPLFLTFDEEEEENRSLDRQRNELRGKSFVFLCGT